ncbi:MAG: DUF2283 domain-containing protein [Chloroflexi bacterium]|nr:DUF2283 domain-containing protein [Chloroflexota bacterium]
MNKPAVHYNPQNDTLYFLVRDGEEERFVAVAEGVNVELDQEGQLLSLEILNASRFLRVASAQSDWPSSPVLKLEAKP